MRLISLCAAVTLLLVIGCGRPAAPAPSPRASATATSAVTTHPITTQPQRPFPVAAVWREPGYGPPTTAPIERLIVGIWNDGTIVWGANRAAGGAPYQTANIGAPRVAKLLADLDAAGLFGTLRQVNFGPDASYAVIAAQSGDKRQWLGSWHDPAPANPNVVITEHGIHYLEPGRPKPIPSKEYQHFLTVWAAARALIEAAIPPTGQPVNTVDPGIYSLGRGH